MDERRRDILAQYVLLSKQLSECKDPRAAVIVRGERVILPGIDHYSFSGSETKISPILMACKTYFSLPVRDEEDGEAELICSYFPSMQEFLLLSTTDIRRVYFMGDIDSEPAVRWLNQHTAKTKETKAYECFEMIKLAT